MKCKKCYSDNGDSRKCCHNCGSILIGYTYNNVNGKYGYRGEDGLFYENKEKCDPIICVIYKDGMIKEVKESDFTYTEYDTKKVTKIKSNNYGK